MNGSSWGVVTPVDSVVMVWLPAGGRGWDGDGGELWCCAGFAGFAPTTSSIITSTVAASASVAVAVAVAVAVVERRGAGGGQGLGAGGFCREATVAGEQGCREK
jgi:hypothetical protein